jgi:beta-galactosidase
MDNSRCRLFDKDWKFFKGELTGAEAAGFDDSNWRKLNLPHDWSIEDLPDQKEGEVVGPFDKKSIGLFYTSYTIGGTGWYRKSFVMDKADKGKEVSVYFDGVYMESDVWINGHHLGSHKHGYTPFCYNLNEFLNQPGEENILSVLVKNIGENSRWYSGSGIYRHVWLRVTDPLNIPVWGVFITTPEVSEKKSKVSAIISVKNNSSVSASFTIKNTIISPDGKVVTSSEVKEFAETGAQIEAQQFLDVTAPELWSVETPFLYTLKTELIAEGRVLDSEETSFGIRSISFSPDKGFLLNGRHVILKGACIHHDNGPLGSVALDRADQRRIELLKANGFNAIRTSHNPPSQGFLDACDRNGILVMDEAFDMWLNPKRADDYHLFFRDWHKSDLQSMILRDRNHPSVIMWSIGNEIRERADSTGLRITAELKGIIKALDTTRPVTEALCEFWETKGRPWSDSAPAYALLDICGYNYVHGEYEKDHDKYPERIIAVTESFALDIFENWKMATEKSYVIGDFVWTGMDYLGEAGIGQVMTDSTTMCWPWMNANCGDLDLIGFKKPQAFYRDVVWDRSKIEMAAEEIPPAGKEWMIRAWGWRREYPSWNWPGNEGRKMKVNVYTKSDEVRLELNGKTIGTKKAEPGSRFIFTFSVPYEPGELKAVALSNGKEVAMRNLVTTGPAKNVQITTDRPIITNNINDLAYLTVELTDSKGNRVTDAALKVKFSVEGEAVLAAVDNGNPRDPKSFQSDSCNTFHGRCLAILRPTGKKGKTILTARCEGMTPVKCAVAIK